MRLRFVTRYRFYIVLLSFLLLFFISFILSQRISYVSGIIDELTVFDRYSGVPSPGNGGFLVRLSLAVKYCIPSLVLFPFLLITSYSPFFIPIGAVIVVVRGSLTGICMNMVTDADNVLQIISHSSSTIILCLYISAFFYFMTDMKSYTLPRLIMYTVCFAGIAVTAETIISFFI